MTLWCTTGPGTLPTVTSCVDVCATALDTADVCVTTLANAATGTLPNSVFQCSIPTAIITLVDSRLVHTRINNTTVTPEFKSLVYIRTKLVTMLVMFHAMFMDIPTKKKMALIFMPQMYEMRVRRELFTHCDYIIDHPIKMSDFVIDINETH